MPVMSKGFVALASPEREESREEGEEVESGGEKESGGEESVKVDSDSGSLWVSGI